MKILNIIYIISIYLGFVLTFETLQPNSKLTLSPDEGANDVSFLFDSSSFQVNAGEINKNIYFKVKAVSFPIDNSNIYYKFISSEDDISSSLSFSQINYEAKSDTEGENTIKYFIIQKTSSDNDLLLINFYVSSSSVDIYNTAKDSSINNIPAGYNENEIIKKYGSKTVKADDYIVVFYSGDFDEGDEMHFKIRAREDAFLFNYIEYQYISTGVTYDEHNLKIVYFTGVSDYEYINNRQYKTSYFNIKKKSNEFRGTDGSYLLIYFIIDYGDVTITNTEEDEGKLETWVIIVIVVAVVLVFAIVIFCICWRRKKQLQAQQAMANAYAQNAANVANVQNAVDLAYAQNAAYSQEAAVMQYQSPPNTYTPAY